MKQLYQRTLLALLALMPTAMWAQTFTGDNLSYTVTGAETVSVSKTAGLTGDVYIPSSVVYEDVTYAVTAIPENAFGNTAITSVTIPASVVSVGARAFQVCHSLTSIVIEDSETPLKWLGGMYMPLYNMSTSSSYDVYLGRDLEVSDVRCYFPFATSVTIGDQVTTINASLFQSAAKLGRVTIGNGVTSIGANAFQGTGTAVETQYISMGNNVTTIGANAFQGCSKLTEITLPDVLTAIPECAFGNTGLTSITIPASVESVGKCAFQVCHSLSSITIEDSETPLRWLGGTYYTPLFNMNDASSYTLYLGRDLSTEGDACYFPYATSVTIGDKVTAINSQLFQTDHVENVKVHGLTPIAISTNSFHSNTYANATLWVPGGTKAAYQAADYWKNFTNIETWSFVLNYTVNGHGTMEIDDVVAANGETKTVRKPNGDGLNNSNWTWTVTPDAGYELTSLTVEDKTEATDPAVQEIFVGNAGWENPHTEGTAINHDLDYVATFAPITYAITYDLAGGTVATANPATYNVESAAITLVNPTREGYTFAGWTGTGLDAASTTVTIPAGSTGDRTYTATWTPITYTIDYDLAGGSVAGGLPASYTIESAAITLVNPTRTGYTFKGWKLDGAGEAQMAVTIAAGSTGNKAYTATWQINQYTITFDSNGGSTVPAITQDYNTAVTPPAAPTKTGYTFAGWTPAVPSTIPAENMTLTAQWTINQYTITFDSNGGSTVPSITQDYASAVTAPAAPTKTGYTFAGWTPAVPSTIPAENKTLTAQWTINQYTITFDTDGGSAVPSITQDYGTAVTAPAAPTKTGYTFVGWTPAVPTTIPAENMTVKAQWTINTYSVSITGAGVTADNMNPKYQDDVVITIAEDPDRTLTSLKVNGEEVKDDMVGNQYTIENVAGNVTVVATFASTKEFISLPASSDMATFSCSQALDFTGVEGLKAYIASGFDGTTVLLTRVEKVPANTGLLLLGTPGVTYKVPYAETTAYYSNLLKPVLTATTVAQTDGAGNTNYLLGKQGDPEVIGFYKAKSAGSAVGAQKAYLQLPSGAVAAGVKSVGFYFDDTTAVEEVKAEATAPEGVFDIHGRKIPAGQKLTRGIYVINGKKVSIK